MSLRLSVAVNAASLAGNVIIAACFLWRRRSRDLSAEPAQAEKSFHIAIAGQPNVYGKRRCEGHIDEQCAMGKQMRHLPIEEWTIFMTNHDPCFIDRAAFQANQARLDANIRRSHQS